MKEAGGQPPTSNRRDVGLGLATLAFGSGLRLTDTPLLILS